MKEIGPVRATCAASIRAKCTASIHYTFLHPMSKAKLPTPVPQQSLVLRIASATYYFSKFFEQKQPIQLSIHTPSAFSTSKLQGPRRLHTSLLDRLGLSCRLLLSCRCFHHIPVLQLLRTFLFTCLQAHAIVTLFLLLGICRCMNRSSALFMLCISHWKGRCILQSF